jgi:hypothetical protein
MTLAAAVAARQGKPRDRVHFIGLNLHEDGGRAMRAGTLDTACLTNLIAEKLGVT